MCRELCNLSKSYSTEEEQTHKGGCVRAAHSTLADVRFSETQAVPQAGPDPWRKSG